MTTRKTGVTRGVCKQMAALVYTLGQDEQDAHLAQKIVEHLTECVTCTKSEADLTEMLAQYRTDWLLTLPPDVEQRLHDRVCEIFANSK